MKIRFLEVGGQVLLDDKYSCQEARTGLVMETGGKPYIILAGDNSFARMVIGSGSDTIHLGANSVLHVNYPRPCLLDSVVHDVRLISGKLWAMIDKNQWKPEQYNHVVGVRG